MSFPFIIGFDSLVHSGPVLGQFINHLSDPNSETFLLITQHVIHNTLLHAHVVVIIDLVEHVIDQPLHVRTVQVRELTRDQIQDICNPVLPDRCYEFDRNLILDVSGIADETRPLRSHLILHVLSSNLTCQVQQLLIHRRDSLQ